jgi:hypothetical protein
LYGITEEKRVFIDHKINRNKEFLRNLTFYTDEFKLVSMFDSDLNANLSPDRYFAEVNNRVNVLFKYARELSLVPAFLTLTAPSAYHFSSLDYNGSTPRETALYLSFLWAKFTRLKLFKHIKDNSGHNMIFIRVYEPHISGVPHLHAMIFVPKMFLNDVKKAFYSYFRDKFHIKQLKFLARFDKSYKYDGVTGAIAYILKYMNKTFKSAKDGVMSSEAYYFAYHGIRRFITSQTLIPLWIYRKVKHDENNRDLYKLTKEYKSGLISAVFNKEFIIKKEIVKNLTVIDNELCELDHYVNDVILYQKNHFIAGQFNAFKKSFSSAPSSFDFLKKVLRPAPLFYDRVKVGYFSSGKFIFYKDNICPDYMLDYELINYYSSLDIEKCNLQHFGYVKNIMIKRGLLNGEIISLNKYKDFDRWYFYTWFKLSLPLDKKSCLVL